MNRSKSYFYPMRIYHNHIKKVLLDTYAYGAENLLDMACGKGGDLLKWMECSIPHVWGYDIDEKSIKECIKRYTELKETYHSVDYKFSTKDLSTNILPKIMDDKKMDVVTCMFAWHYFFKNENTFTTFINSMNNNLKKGGYFICCFFDGDKVVSSIKTLDNQQQFSIVIKNYDKNNLFSNTISVKINDTVLEEKTDEYLIMMEPMINRMKKEGYHLIKTDMFESSYYKWKQQSKKFLKDPERLLSSLNRWCVFIKL